MHSSFRAVLNASPVASLNRLRSAVTASGLELSRERRRLFVLRNTAWSQGRRTQQVLDGLRAHGGTVVTLPEADLRVFRALQQLLEEQPTGLTTWLKERRHASGTALLAPLSCEPAASAALAEAGETPEAPSPPKTADLTGAGEPVRDATPSAITETAQDCCTVPGRRDVGGPQGAQGGRGGFHSRRRRRRHKSTRDRVPRRPPAPYRDLRGLRLRQDRAHPPACRGVRAEGRFGRRARSQQRPRATRLALARASPSLALGRRGEGDGVLSRHRGRGVDAAADDGAPALVRTAGRPGRRGGRPGRSRDRARQHRRFARPAARACPRPGRAGPRAERC